MCRITAVMFVNSNVFPHYHERVSEARVAVTLTSDLESVVIAAPPANASLNTIIRPVFALIPQKNHCVSQSLLLVAKERATKEWETLFFGIKFYYTWFFPVTHLHFAINKVVAFLVHFFWKNIVRKAKEESARIRCSVNERERVIFTNVRWWQFDIVVRWALYKSKYHLNELL